MKASASQLAEIYGVDRRTITNWLNEDPPCPSDTEKRVRVFATQDVAKWHQERAVRDALARKAKAEPVNMEDLRSRRELAQTRLAEIELAVKEGALISTDVHKDVVGEVCDRLRAVLINLPSNHALALEKLGVPAKEAQVVLEEIAEALTRSTRSVGDDIEAEDRDAA